MRTTVVALLATAGLPALAAAQATLVKDIRDVPTTAASLAPRNLATQGDVVYFQGTSDPYGAELWKSDGTAAGTTLVKDIWPGALTSDRERSGSSSPSDLHVVGSVLYFIANDGNTGREVWRSDGTPAGTYSLGDIASGPADSVESIAGGFRVQPFGGAVYFAADDGVHGRELWRSDGTPGGATMVVDLCPGECWGLGFETPQVFGGRLYFAGYGGQGQGGLWRTDGTAAGTEFVVEISLVGADLTPIGGTLFFTAFDQVFGWELFATDGTAPGTHLVKDINPGSAGADPGFLTNVAGTLFFRATDGANGLELWKSDGTAAGTVLVADVNAGPAGSNPNHLTPIGNVVCFMADDVAHGTEVWRSDGTAAGTFLLADSSPGPTAGVGNAIVAQGARIVFSSYSGALWWSDGTVAGTYAVAGPYPGPNDFDLAGGATRAYAAGYQSAPGIPFDYELWRSDGTDAGTTKVFDALETSSGAFGLVAMNDRLVFAAADDAGFEPWSSDGSTAGTLRLGDFCPGPCGSFFPQNLGADTPLARLGPHVYFGAFSDTAGNELWRTDGTLAGTELFADVAPGLTSSIPEHLTAGPTRLFFTVYGQDADVWSTDGSAAGAVPAGPIVPGPSSAFVWSTAAVQDQLFLRADDLVHGVEPWTSDGTAAGTHLVEDLYPGPGGSSMDWLTPSGSTLYFVGLSSSTPLFRSDGTASGTYPIPVLLARPAELTDVAGTLFFRAAQGTTGDELWKTDGSAAGTVMVRDIVAGPLGSRPAHLVNVGGVLFFTASDLAHGVELWRSDGTAAGTVMVKDIVPGPAGSVPSALTAVNGRLYFAAWEPATGVELWTSDGTDAGTVRVQDLVPGPASGSPDRLTIAGSHLFFVATDPVAGREPWALPNVPPSLVVQDVSRAEGDAGTQPATFSVRLVGAQSGPVTATYATANGSATAGADYQPASGSLTFTSGGPTTQSVAVGVIGDTAEEPDEDFTLALGSVSGAVAIGSPARGVILNDDSPVTVSVLDREGPEGDAGLHDLAVDVRLSAPRGVPVTVDYATLDGSAQAAVDYEPRAGTLTFAPGATALPVPVPVRGDHDLEFDETFRLRLANPVNASLGDSEGDGVLLNDEAQQQSGRELVHGSTWRSDLGTPAIFRIAQKPYASYEVVVDEVPGGTYPFLWRMDSVLNNVLGFGEPVGTGGAVSMRWANLGASEVQDEHVVFKVFECQPCDARYRYRIRAYETTLAGPRFFNAGVQRTVVILYNRGEQTVTGQIAFWPESGAPPLHLEPFTLAPRATLKLESAAIPALAGQSGSLTVANDGRFGDLVGKAVAIDPSAGFAFDHVLTTRPR